MITKKISETIPKGLDDRTRIRLARKGEAGTRAWTSNPGEYNGAFDGKFGGMWRARGRVPSKVCGLTFTSYGFDVSSYYKREEDSFKPECAWIFDCLLYTSDAADE